VEGQTTNVIRGTEFRENALIKVVGHGMVGIAKLGYGIRTISAATRTCGIDFNLGCLDD